MIFSQNKNNYYDNYMRLHWRSNTKQIVKYSTLINGGYYWVISK